MSGILKKPTVLAGIVSIAVSAVSLFLPWIIPDFMEEAESVDFFALLREPDLNTFTAIMIVGLVLNLAFCLGGIAKAAAIFGLIDLAMGLFIMSSLCSGGGLGQAGIGMWLFLLGNLGAVISQFATKKTPKNAA